MPPSAETNPTEGVLEGTAALEALAVAVVGAVRDARRAGRTPVVLIDGPSGAGKSSLADRLLAGWPAEGLPRLVRMDDLYPGWEGLDAGSAAVGRELLGPLRATGRGTWERWDWEHHRPAELHTVAGGEPLVIEGCGALSRENASLADLTVWLHADDALRKRRALARDGETFAVEWDRWQAQFDRFVEREHPLHQAALVLDVTGAGLAEPRPGTTVES